MNSKILMELFVTFSCLLHLSQAQFSSGSYNNKSLSLLDLNEEWNVSCDVQNTTVLMYDAKNITCSVKGPKAYSEYHLSVISQDTNIARVSDSKRWLKEDKNNSYYPETFTISGIFIGQTNLLVILDPGNANTTVEVTVIKEKTVLDHVFNFSVIGLVSLMYINFGCAFNWQQLKENLRRPYGPCIGMTLQFFLMPLISFGLARWLFYDRTYLQLGMFFTGVAPSGGASNMWTVMAGGNLDLSLTMTTLSNFIAFGMIPFWVFTLGTVIYAEGEIDIPYVIIVEYCVCLVVPLLIGYALTVCKPNIAQFLARILKTLSGILLACIIVFAIVTNYYIFEMFTWEIILAGLGLPWLGFLFGYLGALAFKRNQTDAITIAIETGIQNTGVPIMLLKAALAHPFSDLSIVIPVAVAVMTPLPLIVLVSYKALKRRYEKRGKERRKLMDGSDCSNSPMSEYNDNNYNLTGPKNQEKLKMLEDQLNNTMDLQCNI